MAERDFKGIWMPKEIWLANDIGWSAKLLLVEIESLEKNGECFASNDYFAQFFSLSKDRISKLVTELKEKGYVEVTIVYKPGSKQVDKRVITTIGYRRKCLQVIGENSYTPMGESNDRPIGENAEDNNTSFNNTFSNNTENKKKSIKKKTSPKETNTTLFERIYLDYCLSENLISKLREWMKYKSERKDEYAEQGLRTLLRRIENKYLEFGKQDTTICELIDESMSNLWKGIIFDRLKAPATVENKSSFDIDELFDLAIKKSYSKNPRSVHERQAVERMETKKEPQTVDAERLEALKQRLAK